jgi:hypothetical protein
MSLLGRILDASNAFLKVTNFQGTQGTIGESQTTFIPLGTVGAVPTGEVAVKVIVIADSSGGTSTYTSNPVLVTTSGSIAVGARSWSFSAVSGTVTLNGSALANGTSVSGGGYPGFTLGTAIPYTISGGSAFLTTDT